MSEETKLKAKRKKKKPPVSRRLSTEARILRVTGRTKEDLFVLQVEQACRFLEDQGMDEVDRFLIHSTRPFWRWFLTQWETRDKRFLESYDIPDQPSKKMQDAFWNTYQLKAHSSQTMEKLLTTGFAEFIRKQIKEVQYV